MRFSIRQLMIASGSRTFLCLIIAIILLSIAFIRDLGYERLYPDDLRNRVVGARLIYDGQLPYFYKWKPQDGMRYYDPANFNNKVISNITASPFLHQLIIPFCNLPQRTLSFMWFLGQYAILIFLGVLAYRYASSQGKDLCILITAAFPFTDGWIRHILTGQFYLLIPFLLFLIYVLLNRKQVMWHIVLAATCTLMVILIRPFAFLSFVPLLFVLPVTRRFIIACIIIGVGYLFFVVASPFQLNLYKEYNRFVEQTVNMHAGKQIQTHAGPRNPGYRNIEGFNIAEIRTSKKRDQITSRNEHGNFFVIYRKVFSRQLPQQWLLWGSLLAAAMITGIFFYGTANHSRTLAQCMLIGFIIYMALEMFLPIHRHQYNTVQFLFPLLLFAIHFRNSSNLYTWLVIAGLLLNIIKWELFPMKNTVGEFMMLAGFFLAIFFNPKLSSTEDH